MSLVQTARVCASFGERLRLQFADSESEAAVSGALLFEAATQAELPVTGDWVEARRAGPDFAIVERVLPRRSRIARRAAGRRDDEQVLAANVDLALLVCGLDGDANNRRLERYCAIARQGGVEPVVVLNKADVCADVAQAVTEASAAAHSALVIAVSARTGEGCGAIRSLLAEGVTAVLLGSSGAGKSTLLNRLAGTELHPTAEVRASDKRGKHTTTHRELIVLEGGGALIDTPGLREIQLWASEESVSAVFDEIAALAGECRFRDCTHASEPGCAVRGSVDPARLASFHKLRRETRRITEAPYEKERWRGIHKEMRRFYKARGR